MKRTEKILLGIWMAAFVVAGAWYAPQSTGNPEGYRWGIDLAKIGLFFCGAITGAFVSLLLWLPFWLRAGFPWRGGSRGAGRPLSSHPGRP